MTREEATGIAARLWCLPANSATEMDATLAGSIADALVEYTASAWIEGRDTAIDSAAMLAHDMGRPDIREAINRLVERGR